MSHIRTEIQKLWGDAMEQSIWEETQRICNEKLEWDTMDSSICRNIYTQVLMKILVAKKKKCAIPDTDIASASYEIIDPDTWKAIKDKQDKTNALMFETRQEVATDDFTCPKCHQKKCTYYQLQTRSADEPMTTFVTCIHCGKRWKC